MHIVAKAKEQHEKRTRLKKVLAGDLSPLDQPESAPVWGETGWLTSSTPCQQADDRDPLIRHADWFGPAKLVGSGHNVRRLTEVYLSCESFNDQVFDGESREQSEALLADLRGQVFSNRFPADKLEWSAPDTDKLVGWLRESGFQPVVDDDDNLRMTLKARGCDGQVHLSRDAQSLRFSMQLGTWSDLDEGAERAMLHLARQANDRARLARIAWIETENTRCCQAQVDLAGLPTEGPAERIWPSMLSMSMHGLKLALRRLGMELDVLANPAHRDMAAQMIASDLEEVGSEPATVSNP